MHQFRTILEATRRTPTPFLWIEPTRAAHNVSEIRRSLPGVEVWYALKSNMHRDVVQAVLATGAGFEIASLAELHFLENVGCPASRMMCLHPIKNVAFLEALGTAGVSYIAADTTDEIRKIARHAPMSRVVLRIAVDGRGSRIPLMHKFGCEIDQAVALARFASDAGVRVAGVTMHVGSQCESVATWEIGLENCREACCRLTAEGLTIDLISLGGGLPVPYDGSIVDHDAIGAAIHRAGLRDAAAPGCRVTIEPGRAISASAGTLVVSVVGVAERRGIRWVYVDAGIYGGLMEGLREAGGLRFPVRAATEIGPSFPTRIAGPTCDSLDVLHGEFNLPDLAVGDRLAVGLAGAYTIEIAAPFNGFAPPRVIVAPSLEMETHV